MRIYVAGNRGLVGQSFCRMATLAGHEIVNAPRVDLRDTALVHFLFRLPEMQAVDAVVCAAARVGGIGANAADPIGFLLDNIRISTNLIEAAAQAGIRRFVNLGSSCIYPRNCQQPMREEELLSGPLETTNEGYALAKIAALKLVQFYRDSGRSGYISLMPTNLYGPGDRYHELNSHVIPALIMKLHAAMRGKASSVTLWGTGSPLREIMHVDDLARAIILALDGPPMSMPWINVGPGESAEISIRDLSSKISEILGYRGQIVWDADRPDGTPRKLLDSTRIRNELGWAPSISLDDGLARTIEEYQRTQNAVTP